MIHILTRILITRILPGLLLHKRVLSVNLNQSLDVKSPKTGTTNEKDDRSKLPIRERIPLPDLGAMKRMMSNLHRSNQIAEKREKDACKRKLEVEFSFLGD